MTREPEYNQPGCIAMPDRDPDEDDKDWDLERDKETCPACDGCGEYRTERGWWPCTWCKGKGII